MWFIKVHKGSRSFILTWALWGNEVADCEEPNNHKLRLLFAAFSQRNHPKISEDQGIADP